MSQRGEQATTAWVALDDATETNGCLHFAPGSHRAVLATGTPYSLPDNTISQALGGLFAHPALTGLEPRPQPARAGDVILHNGLGAHGAGANMTRGRRRAMTIALMPEGHNVFNGKKNVLNDRCARCL